MNPDQIRQIIRAELAGLLFRSDRVLLSKLLELNDGRNVQVGKTTGTKIGTSTDQKLAFLGATPRTPWVAHTTSAATDYIVTNTYGTGLFVSNGLTSDQERMNMLNNLYQMAVGFGLIIEAA